MDKFTRIYSLVLLVIGFGVLISLFYERPIVSELNAVLKSDDVLSNYRYQFRVIKIEHGVASMTTPRSAEFPTSLGLPLLYPELRNVETNSASFLEAQQELARAQGIARKLVIRHDEVTDVVWTLDTKWLRNHGINPDLLTLATSHAGNCRHHGTYLRRTDSDGACQLRLADSIRRRQHAAKRIYGILSRGDAVSTTRGTKRAPLLTRSHFEEPI